CFTKTLPRRSSLFTYTTLFRSYLVCEPNFEIASFLIWTQSRQFLDLFKGNEFLHKLNPISCDDQPEIKVPTWRGMRQRPGARRASFDPASAELAAADGIHRLRVFQGGKISRLLSQIGRLDHPAEDFAVARFGQLRDEMNLLRPKRLPHVASHHVDQFVVQRLRRLVPRPQDDETDRHLSLSLVGNADNRRLQHRRVIDEDRLHFRGPQPL